MWSQGDTFNVVQQKIENRKEKAKVKSEIGTEAFRLLIGPPHRLGADFPHVQTL